MNPGPMSPGDSADTIAAYTSACAFFGERLATVTDLDWERPTPCEGWDVRTLVAHVVTGEALVAQVLSGGGSWDAAVDPSVLGLNPMASWRGTALALALDGFANGAGSFKGARCEPVPWSASCISAGSFSKCSGVLAQPASATAVARQNSGLRKRGNSR